MFRFMSKFDPGITLCQTADFIKEAQDLVKEVTLDELLTDSIKLRAFERIMELVGESIKRVPQDFRDAYPEIPWR